MKRGLGIPTINIKNSTSSAYLPYEKKKVNGNNKKQNQRGNNRIYAHKYAADSKWFWLYFILIALIRWDYKKKVPKVTSS